jgi:SPW repeat
MQSTSQTRLAPPSAEGYACAQALPRRRAEPIMAAVTFTPPEHWEDWCDWALGIWLMLSPWVLLFEYDIAATRNAVIVGFLIVSAEAVTLSYFRVWEEWINVALGTWLIVSPWVLGVASVAAQANLLVAGLALYQVWEVGRRPGGQAKA